MIVSDAPEDNLDSETEKLLKEIEERVNKLKQKGISHYILENLLRKPIEPSHIILGNRGCSKSIALPREMVE